MKKSNYLIWLGIAAAAGTAAGVFSDRKNAAKGGLLGAVAGIVAGAAAAGVYEYVASKEKFPYYSEVSPLYEEMP